MKREDISKIFEGATEEQINAVLDINSADIGRAKSKLEAERDNYKEQLETAQTALKGFDGIDVESMKTQIAQLTADMSAKESEYQSKLADMEFNSVLDAAITKSGARNEKALKALLDIDTLKASKNQTEDINAAIEKVKAENDYLFEGSKPVPNIVAKGGSTPSDSKMSLVQAMKYANEHPDIDIKTLI